MYFTNNIVMDEMNNKQYYDMNNYNFLSPPMSGSEGSLSPTNYIFQSPTNEWSNHAASPYLEIKEQPARKFRFRYKSEMAGTHGSLNGNSTEKNRKQTFPTVQLKNFQGPAIIRCSLYQCSKNIRNRQPHAHRLVQKVGSEEVDDPHDKRVSENEQHTAIFHNMGIIHTAKKHLIDELKKKKMKIKEEENRRNNIPKINLTEEAAILKEATEESKSINLNIVCLRFDAFIETNGILLSICEPVYSDEIYNLKSALTGELKIVRMDHCTSPAQGQKEIFLLVEKVTKKNIKVRFFEVDENDQEIWQADGIFNDADVHHQYAIVIKTPPYKDQDISDIKHVFIELLRPSDGARSLPLQFSYHPDKSSRRKRPRYEYSSSNFSSGDIPTTLEDDIPELSLLQSEELFKFIGNADYADFQEIVAFNPQISNYKADNVKNGYSNSKRNLQNIEKEYQELLSFLQTKPTGSRIKHKLQCLIEEKFLQNNILHLAIKYVHYNRVSMELIKLVFDLIERYGENNVLNDKNGDGETLLHIAVNENLLQYVQTLIKLNIDASIVNSEGNTALHLSIIKKNTCYTALLKSPDLSKFLNKENYKAYTPLQLAVKFNNEDAVNQLCRAGADVNVYCKKNGHTLLHTAVINGQLKIVKLLLEKNIDLTKHDFSGASSQMLAHSLLDKHNNNERYQILQIIENKLKQMGIYSDVDIKKECDSDNEDFEVEIVIKEENLSVDELKTLYQNVQEFTPSCLETLSAILNADNIWKELPKHLDLEYLLSTDIFSSSSNPTKTLFEIALGRGVSIFQIRMSLQDIEEYDAVRILDDMVSTLK